MSQTSLIDTGAAPRPLLGELVPGQQLEGVFGVRERDLRQKRNGEAWLRLVLCDRSGSVEAVSWEEAETRYGLAQPGSALAVSGVFEVNERWGPKIKLAELRARGARGVPARGPRPRARAAARAPGGGPAAAAGDDPRPRALRAAGPLLRRGIADLGPISRGAGGEVLPPGLPPRPARAHDLGRASGQRCGGVLSRHRPRHRGQRRPPARHRQDRGLQRRPDGDRSHRRRAPARRDPARLLPRPPADRGDPRLSIPPLHRRCCTSSSATTVPSSTARRWFPALAKRSSCT